mgnify:CR=1 FL=1
MAQDIEGDAQRTRDQYQADYYASLESGVEGPWRRPTSLHPRSVKGGSYYDDPEELRSSNRIESSLNWKKRDPQIPKSFWWNTDSEFVGFRLVRPLEQPSKEEIELFFSSMLE